jgi:hypothetical protein
MNQEWRQDNLGRSSWPAAKASDFRPLMQQWLGQHKPKQYCTFIGTRSMLQHTWDRADQISDPSQK